MNLMDLFVRIGIKDEASEGIDTVGSKLKTGLATAAKVDTRTGDEIVEDIIKRAGLVVKAE